MKYMTKRLFPVARHWSNLSWDLWLATTDVHVGLYLEELKRPAWLIITKWPTFGQGALKFIC